MALYVYELLVIRRQAHKHSFAHHGLTNRQRAQSWAFDSMYVPGCSSLPQYTPYSVAAIGFPFSAEGGGGFARRDKTVKRELDGD